MKKISRGIQINLAKKEPLGKVQRFDLLFGNCWNVNQSIFKRQLFTFRCLVQES